MNYGYHPVNLFVRFLLELTTFIAVGHYGYNKVNGGLKYIAMLLLPLLLATIWGIFATPNDKSRSGKTIVKTSGLIRLLIEFLIFGLGGYALLLLDLDPYWMFFTVSVILHYLLSWDRIIWLLKQK